MVTQAAGGAARLRHDMPFLADFPCCDIPARAADSKYPPLQWQQRAAKVAVHRAAAHASWLQVLHSLCYDFTEFTSPGTPHKGCTLTACSFLHTLSQLHA